MKIQSVGTRGTVFQFEDPYLTNVYVIIGEKRVYVCDTFCGSDSMQFVIDYLEEKGVREKPVVVFNSHFHYDHVWGNLSFPDSIILAHNICRDKQISEGEQWLEKYSEHKRGEVRLVYPNMTFAFEVIFPDDGVMFFYSPGHTAGSASCFDSVDSVLFVGDNVETPIPYLYEPDIDTYVETLKSYIDLEWDVLVTGHDPVMTDDHLVRENLEYLEKLQAWNIDVTELDEGSRGMHIMNMAELAALLPKEKITPALIEYFGRLVSYLEDQEMTPQIEEYLSKLKVIATMNES